jgi:hypothetical protein
LNGQSFKLQTLLQHNPIKTIDKLKLHLQEISDDIQNNPYQDTATVLDLDKHKLINFNTSELEKLKRYYFETSAYFKLYHCFLLEQYTSAEVIAKECGLSINQYYRYAQDLNERLKHFSIEIINRKLVGKEYVIRFFTSHLYAQFLSPDSLWFNQEYNYSEKHMTTLLADTLQPYSLAQKHWLTCCYFVTKQRIKNDHFFNGKTMNTLLRDNLFEEDSESGDFVRDLAKQFLGIASNLSIVKLTPEILHDEVIYLIHIIPLSGLRFKFDLMLLLHTDIIRKLNQASHEIEMLYNERSYLPMSVTQKAAFINEVYPLLLTLMIVQDNVDTEPTETFNNQLIDYYPVGVATAFSMLDRVLKVLLKPENRDHYYLWGAELASEFVYTAIAFMSYDRLLPEITVALEFTHAFNARVAVQDLLTHVTEANIKVVTSEVDADILITNVARTRDRYPHDRSFFFNALPSYDEWQDIKAAIIVYSTQRYYNDRR